MAITDSTAVKISASNGTFLVSPCDVNYVKTKRWSLTELGAVITTVADRSRFLHRLLLNPPDHLVVDHINGNPSDNRRPNIRICTQAENLRNGRPHRDGKSKWRGVCPTHAGSNWRAQICYNYKVIWLGSYSSEVEAAIAYDLAAVALFGVFSRPNFTKIPPGVALGIDIPSIQNAVTNSVLRATGPISPTI